MTMCYKLLLQSYSYWLVWALIQKIQAFAYLVFPNSPLSVIPKGPSAEDAEPIDYGIITSVTHGVMPGKFYTTLFRFCLQVNFYQYRVAQVSGSSCSSKQSTVKSLNLHELQISTNGCFLSIYLFKFSTLLYADLCIVYYTSWFWTEHELSCMNNRIHPAKLGN